MVVIDIDAFKVMNDIYGIEVGNEILKSFAQVLSEYAKEIDAQLYRVGADEFVFLMEKEFDNRCREKIEALSERITMQKIVLNKYDIEIYIDATMGVGCDEKALEKAEMALNMAQEERKRFVIYKDYKNIRKNYIDYLYFTKLVRDVIKQKGVVPFFQKIVGEDGNYYEALMRIENKGAIITPDKFLDTAKKAKLYPGLSKIMIERCLQIAKEENQTIRINLSYQDFEIPYQMEFLIERLNFYAVGKNIIFEITESEAIKDFQRIVEFIQLVKKYKVQIAIDDFGSGYSNFENILQLHPQYLKIDGSLIKEITTKKEAAYIVETIVDFTNKLSIVPIAEYVSSEEIYKKCQDLHIKKFQGFYFGRPTKRFE